MYGRWYTSSIVVLWLAAMTWLITQKVLPPMLSGDPPNQRAIVEARAREKQVGWDVLFNQRPLGWAVSSTTRQANRQTEISARVHIDDLPIRELTPGWMQTLFKLADQPETPIRFDARNRLMLSADGRVLRFHSAVDFHPLNETIALEGRVDGRKLSVTARSGDFAYSTSASLPANALLGDSLSPQTQLPGLHVGQTWTAPAFSPLRPPNMPMEVLRATVERRMTMKWAGQECDVWLVTVRAESGLSVLWGSRPCGRLWVRLDGTVVKQEIALANSVLTFQRMESSRARSLLRDQDRAKRQSPPP